MNKTNKYHKEIADAIEFKEKEEEIIESYEDKEEIDEEEIKDNSKKIKIAKIIINVVFSIITLLIILVTIDVICVSRYNKGPYFAILTQKYRDGGTKEYYGLGYKVIKYHQIQGRRDMEIGKWDLKYNTDPITMKDVDLAIEFNDDSVKTYNKYYKKFVRIISTLKKVDKKNHSITIGYQDEGNKYSLDIQCDIVKDQKDLDFKEGKEITIIGTVEDLTVKTKNKPNTIYVSNCFAEQ